MTPHDDYLDDMGTPLLDDGAIEAFFLGTGQSSWGQNQALLTLVEEVLVATGGPPPRPSGPLLAFLNDSTWATSCAPAVGAVPAEPASARSRWQPRAAEPPATATEPTNLHFLSRRLRVTVGLAAGVGIAAAALTVAGTAGVIPDPAMRAVVRVVEAVTPFELSEPNEPSLPMSPAPVPGTNSDPPVTAVAGSVVAGHSEPTEQVRPVTPNAGAAATGIDRARETPAADHLPPFVPAGPGATAVGGGGAPPGTGVDRARETPAGAVIPPVPGAPPGRP